MYCFPISGASEVCANVDWLSWMHCVIVFAVGPRTTSVAVCGVQAA